MIIYYEIAAILFLIIGISAFLFFKRPPSGTLLKNPAEIDRQILLNEVAFYAKLNESQRNIFEADIRDFLSRVTITPVNTDISEEEILLIACGAIIPVFHFPNWKYFNLREVLVYPDNFNHDFESSGKNFRNILGMVGNGYMEGTMILSKPAIRASFNNPGDKSNTVIHEFVHLIDKVDGETDGVPNLLLERQYVLPWLDMIHQEMLHIAEGKSDINVYAYTNKAEFFAVASEYFFERPELLEKNHPQLYMVLNRMFSGNKKAPEKEP